MDGRPSAGRPVDVVNALSRQRALIWVSFAAFAGGLGFAGSGSAAVSHWSVQATPSLDPTQDARFFGISCTSSTACVLVGVYIDGPLFVERWNGLAWSQQPAPSPPYGALIGVSCPSRTDCVAVGTGDTYLLVETWNGKTWSIQHAPNPKGATGSELLGVSCTSIRACFAVGDWTPANQSITYPLVERWDGSRWSIQPTAEPYGTKYNVGFTAVSCTSRTACTAVAEDDSSAGVVAERWDGHRWSVQKFQTLPGSGPDGSSSTVMNAVSCASSRACVAVGKESNLRGSGLEVDYEVAEFWNGKRWGELHREETTNARGNAGLGAVSCVSATACLAVGSNVERWNGSHWSNVPTPFNNGTSQLESLNNVSCTSLTSCEVFGTTIVLPTGPFEPLWARWTS